jgi:hypothetical protein
MSSVRQFWDHCWRPILTALVLMTALICSRALTQPHKLNDNVYTLKLVRRCYVDYHASIQPVGLACPGVDYIRLRP